MRLVSLHSRSLALLTLAAAVLLLVHPATAFADDGEGSTVYVMGNQADGNTVIVFHRARNSDLVRVQEVSTHGLGSGGTNDPLGSQGALTLADGGRLLFAVNAGSNELSVLEVTRYGVRFVDKISSGGMHPVSVTVHGRVAYVLNAAGTPNISGFFISHSGRLQAIPGSTRALPGGANAGPAEVRFSPDGGLLVVTEKNTNQIDLFAVDDYGRIFRQTSQPSNNATPFGFSFGRNREMVLSEAAGGAPDGATVSSYRVVDEDADADDLRTVSKSVPDTQTAACWVEIAGNGHIAFVSNTGSGTVSSFFVDRRGALKLITGSAADLGAGSGVIDMALSRGSRFLYVLSSSLGTVTGFRVEGGHLIKVTAGAGLPASIQGLAAE